MANILHRVPQFAATMLIVIAIANLLIGVFLRYFVGAIADYLDMEPVPYVWVEEVGEMALAWLTLIGAAIGVRQRSHFTLHVFVHRLPVSYQRIIEILNHLLIAVFGIAVAWYGVGLSRMNMGLSTPGLGISMGWLYASSVVGGVLLAIYAISMIIQPSLVIDEGGINGSHRSYAGICGFDFALHANSFFSWTIRYVWSLVRRVSDATTVIGFGFWFSKLGLTSYTCICFCRRIDGALWNVSCAG